MGSAEGLSVYREGPRKNELVSALLSESNCADLVFLDAIGAAEGDCGGTPVMRLELMGLYRRFLTQILDIIFWLAACV